MLSLLEVVTSLSVTQKRPYSSLQDFMERTSTNGTKLLKMIQAHTGHVISPTMLSFILRGSRRCSYINAMAIHMTTGVSMDALLKRETSREATTVRRLTKRNRVFAQDNDNVS